MYYISLNYFYDPNFKKALEVIDMLSIYYPKGENKNLITLINLYKLILYFETGKADLLIYSIQNTYRFLYKNNCYSLMEKTLIKLLKDLIVEPSEKYRKDIWTSALTLLLPLYKEVHSRHTFALFNFPGWIHCKLEGKSLKEISFFQGSATLQVFHEIDRSPANTATGHENLIDNGYISMNQ